jgi:AraC family transcriptional regulator
MTELLVNKQAHSTSIRYSNEPPSPGLYLSSTQAGWDGLCAQAIHEPREMESSRVPARSGIVLELFTGGAIHVERRQEQGSWKGEDMHHGDLFLNWGGGPSYEVRWWSLSPVPTQTLGLLVSRTLVERVAQEMMGIELAGLELVGRSSFRDPLVSQIAFALWRELEQPAPAGNLYAQAAASMLAVHLVRHYTSRGATLQAVPPPPRSMTKRQVQHVLEFIQAHLNEQLSLDSLARQAGFSSPHFALLFQRATGASPHQFVLRQRIERAQWLLQETDLSLAQIASACGFAHQSHLNQVFKRHLGCTPRAYRREASL